MLRDIIEMLQDKLSELNKERFEFVAMGDFAKANECFVRYQEVSAIYEKILSMSEDKGK